MRASIHYELWIYAGMLVGHVDGCIANEYVERNDYFGGSGTLSAGKGIDGARSAQSTLIKGETGN